MKFTAFLMGIGLGAAVAVLFAPASGEETREMLQGRVRDGRIYARRRAREMRHLAEDIADRSREGVQNLRDLASGAVEMGKQEFERQKNAVGAAANAATETYKREAQA